VIKCYKWFKCLNSISQRTQTQEKLKFSKCESKLCDVKEINFTGTYRDTNNFNTKNFILEIIFLDISFFIIRSYK